MSVTSELLDRLRRHYIKPGDRFAGGVFIPEVGVNGTWSGVSVARRCDAIYVGFTSSSGRVMIGHELKVSRADWRHELDDPSKADQWADQCHEWYVVAPSTAVVPPEELPAGWGLMVPNARSKVRMDKLVRSAIKPPGHCPSWDAMRSILGRLDTLQVQTVADVRRTAKQEARAKIEADTARVAEAAAEISLRADSRTLDRIEELLGISFRRHPGQSWDLIEQVVSPELLADAIKISRARAKLTERWDGLQGGAHDMRRLADRLDELAKLMRSDEPARVAS